MSLDLANLINRKCKVQQELLHRLKQNAEENSQDRVPRATPQFKAQAHEASLHEKTPYD